MRCCLRLGLGLAIWGAAIAPAFAVDWRVIRRPHSAAMPQPVPESAHVTYLRRLVRDVHAAAERGDRGEARRLSERAFKIAITCQEALANQPEFAPDAMAELARSHGSTVGLAKSRSSAEPISAPPQLTPVSQTEALDLSKLVDTKFQQPLISQPQPSPPRIKPSQPHATKARMSQASWKPTRKNAAESAAGRTFKQAVDGRVQAPTDEPKEARPIASEELRSSTGDAASAEDLKPVPQAVPEGPSSISSEAPLPPAPPADEDQDVSEARPQSQPVSPREELAGACVNAAELATVKPDDRAAGFVEINFRADADSRTTSERSESPEALAGSLVMAHEQSAADWPAANSPSKQISDQPTLIKAEIVTIPDGWHHHLVPAMAFVMLLAGLSLFALTFRAT